MDMFRFEEQGIMEWNIASAKQQFSEVVRLAMREPQVIYNRNKPVAMLISADDFADYQRLQAQQQKSTPAAQFADIRAILAAEGTDGIDTPPRVDRPNPFSDF